MAKQLNSVKIHFLLQSYNFYKVPTKNVNGSRMYIEN